MFTGISAKHIGNLVKKAVENGWRADQVFLNNYFKNKPGLGCKKTITSNLKQKVINYLQSLVSIYIYLIFSYILN